jgi:hypothetical protein
VIELSNLLKEIDQAQAELKRAVDNNSGYIGSDE